MYYGRDADVNLIKGKRVVLVGFGYQGHAYALNMKDSGVKEVSVALRPGSASVKKAESVGLGVTSVAEAAKSADLMMMCTPGLHDSDAALLDQVDDQLVLVQALEICHFRSVASLHQISGDALVRGMAGAVRLYRAACADPVEAGQ